MANRIFVTGDTHGNIDIKKVTTQCFKTQKELDKSDILIVCGDFGVVWDGAGQDRYIQNWWNDKNFTTCFVDGNHENFTLLDQYPIEMWNGGKIHRIKPNVIHLMRGQVFTIAGKTFYTMGGAVSIDQMYRKPYVSWWPEEIPSFEEQKEGFQNLRTYGDKVDYILTHDGPATIVAKMYARQRPGSSYYPDGVARGFDAVAQAVQFKHWFFGHHHFDDHIWKYTCCYQNVIEIG